MISRIVYKNHNVFQLSLNLDSPDSPKEMVLLRNSFEKT